jgi:hypothetical protein
MFNTIRVRFDRTKSGATSFVFSDANNPEYLAEARAKVAELGDRVDSIEIEEWYSERKIKSSKLVDTI